MLAARSRRARTNARGQASREHLLEAAIDLLREKGYAGLSIAALCARADIAPTSVYWHFGNKAGLMEAVIERIGGGHTRKIRESVDAARTPGEQLDRLIAGVRELVTSQPLGSLTGVAVVGEGRHVTPELHAALKRVRDREFEEIAAGFEAALGSPGAASTLTVVVLACTNYAALTHRMQGSAEEVDRILEGLRDAVIRIAGGEAARPERHEAD